MPSPDAIPLDSPRRPSQYPAVLFAILILGAALRLSGIGIGLPAVEYVDAFKFTGAAAAMAKEGNFEPREFQNPALYADTLALLDRALKLDSPLAQGLAARLVCAFAGIALVWVVWRAARTMLSPAAALLAAALAAVSIELVTLSRYPMTDILLALFMFSGMAVFIGENENAERPLLAGLCLGLAIATKWTGLYLGLFFVLATALRIARTHAFRRPLAGLASASIFAVATFLFFNSYFLSHIAEYRARFLLEMQIQSYGQIGRVQGGWFDYLTSQTPTWEMPWMGTSLVGNMGPILAATAVAGTIIALLRRPSQALAMHALFVVLYLALIVRPGHIKAARFLAPILPSLLILAAGCIDSFSARLRYGKAFFAIAAIVLPAFPLYKSLRLASLSPHAMTNKLAREKIDTNLAYEPGLFVEPFFTDDLATLARTPLFLSGVGPRQYRLPGDPKSNAELDPIYSPQLLDDLRAQKIEWIIANSWFDGAFSPVTENLRWFPKATAAYAAWRKRLAEEATLAWSIDAEESGHIGPDIEIWHLNPTATEPQQASK